MSNYVYGLKRYFIFTMMSTCTRITRARGLQKRSYSLCGYMDKIMVDPKLKKSKNMLILLMDLNIFFFTMN